MKIRMIAPLGMSPPVITEGILYLERSKQIDVSDVVLLATQNQDVEASVDLIKTCLNVNRPNCMVSVRRLNFEDIKSSEDNAEFMKAISREIKEAWVEGYKEVHLNVAGGRKDMCISASIVGSFLNVNSVFHIISPDVKTANMELERMREKINKLHKSEDKISYYKENREDFDRLMFPDVRTWYGVEIPILPYPRGLLRLCKKILSKDIIRYEELKGERLENDFLESLQKLGYADVTKKEIRVSALGRMVGSIIPQV